MELITETALRVNDISNIRDSKTRNFIIKTKVNDPGYICSSLRTNTGVYKVKSNNFRYSLRFNLSAGDLKFKWMVTDRKMVNNGGDILVHFYEPSLVSFTSNDAFLYNNENGAKKLNITRTKEVVAMVLTNDLNITAPKGEGKIKVSYNPHVLPYWWYSTPGGNPEGLDLDDEGNPKSIDGERLSIITSGSTIFKN